MAGSLVELAKRAAAEAAVTDFFRPTFKLVGIGSGSTVRYVVEAIESRMQVHRQRSSRPTSTVEKSEVGFVPTSEESRRLIENAGLRVVEIDQVDVSPESSTSFPIDVAFDGADEVDSDLNCIKGGGACLFREKVVVEMARRFICVGDYRKAQSHLLKTWPTVPIEIAPKSAPTVISRLTAELGFVDPKVRLTKSATPLLTDQGFYIIDAPYPSQLKTTSDNIHPDTKSSPTPHDLSDAIRSITGVLEVGLFTGLDGDEAAALLEDDSGAAVGTVIPKPQRPVAVYFGEQDGSVSIRKAVKSDN